MQISIDFEVCASKEAKICLTCDKRNCKGGQCKRYRRMKKELKQEELHRKEKTEIGREISK